MNGNGWDWEEQRRESAEIYRELLAESGIEPGTRVTLVLHFLPSEEDSDEEALIRALESFGYDVAVEPEDDTVEAAIDDVPFTEAEVWKHESRTTKIALARGYAPDGWGFLDPDAEEDGEEA